MPDSLHTVDGSQDFSGGIDSSKVTTISSESNPNGLDRNQLAYLINGNLRDGAIQTRTGWKYLKTLASAGSLYQGGMMYEPENENPYLLLSLSGHILQVPCSPDADTDLSEAFGLFNPPAERQAFFCQGEQFAVIQAGDYLTAALGHETLPLFWDGSILRRSKGITNPAVAPGTPGVNEIPAAGPMDYYMGRLWYAQARVYSAGDIVKGTSGTLPYEFRDAILNVTESPLCIGGDGFVVPSNAGNIRALRHSANLDTALGQGQLFIFTQKSIYSLDVPIDRTAWLATNNNSQPLQKVVQITNGAVGDRSVVSVNGDLFFQSLEPGIRSLITAIRYFNQWGNTPISSNLERLLNFQDRALMRLSTGIEWNNRLIMGMRPVQTDAGVAHQALVSLDFSPVSGFAKKLPPCWEGHWEGIKALQLFSSTFGGLQRAFAVIVSDVDGSIQLWELTDFERKDISIQGDSRVTMVIEFPAFNFGNPFELKKLVTAELWLDKMIGTVDFYMEYRPDADACWHFWHRWQLCTQKDCSEDPLHPCDISYPYVETPFCEMDKTTITLPKPPNSCQSSNGRPAYQGYQFQTRLTIKGWARVRGMLLHAEKMDKPLYANIACNV